MRQTHPCPDCGTQISMQSTHCEVCCLRHRGTPRERFEKKVQYPSDPNGCWIWTGAKNSAGYGQLKIDGHAVYAHRLSYEWHVGPIPPDMTIDHLCRTPACCNPAHLEVVTMKENLLRSTSPAAKNARKTHCLRGHPLDKANTYINAKGQRSCLICRDASDRRLRQKT
jgi:hypothetical protein